MCVGVFTYVREYVVCSLFFVVDYMKRVEPTIRGFNKAVYRGIRGTRMHSLNGCASSYARK